MNVFEDLIVELKEENLLEETIIEQPVRKSNGAAPLSIPAVKPEMNGFAVSGEHVSRVSGHGSKTKNTFEPAPSPETVRRRLGDKLQALQSIEYVLTSVESNFGSKINQPFDDLQTKKAFHTFEQASADPESDQYFEAESTLITRLDVWEDALAARDRHITTDSVRHYAEKANPPLSPQTLFALLRFYRSLPFTEDTRAKFDFVLTRLFSKRVEGENRDLICARGEIVRHLSQRYSEWSAERFSRINREDPDATLLVLSCDDFIAEAESASDVNEVLSNNLFERICQFKQNAGELFMTPEVAAAAVECNIRVSNKVVELVQADLERKNSSRVQAKYSGLDRQVISNAVGRLLEFGKQIEDSDDGRPEVKQKRSREAPRPVETKKRESKAKTAAKSDSRIKSSLLGVNKWLLLATILTVIASVGVYIWSEYYAGDEVSTTGVKVVDLEKPELKKYIKVSKLSGNMLYAVVSPDYEKLDADAQREYLQKVRQQGSIKGYSKVSFINESGKAVGYASDERIETSK